MYRYTALFLAALLALSEAASTTASANSCTKAPYKDLTFLSKYGPAESFCSSKYPVPAQTVTVTVGAGRKRAAPYTTKTTTTTTTTKKTTTTTKPTTTTTSACTGTCSAWSSCAQKGGDFLSTLCSCIETPKTVTVTKTTTTTTTSTTSSGYPYGTCESGQITGPARCGCYYEEFCDNQYFGPVNKTAKVNSARDCIELAGQVNTGTPYALRANFYETTGICEVLNDFTGSAQTKGVIALLPTQDASPCRYRTIEDPNHVGCGCVYNEECGVQYQGDLIGGVQNLGYAQCVQACDNTAGCVGASFDGGSFRCQLYSSITGQDYAFIDGLRRVSCANPCTA